MGIRRIVNRVTADGYFAGPDGNLEWVVPDEELGRSVAGAIERSSTDPNPDAILFGRRTYEMFEAFGPKPSTGHDRPLAARLA